MVTIRPPGPAAKLPAAQCAIAAVFGTTVTQLLTQCATCGGHPPPATPA